MLKITLLGLIFTLCLGKTFSQTNRWFNSNFSEFGIRRVMFNYIINDSVESNTQIESKECWAACVQMIYYGNGLAYDQIFFVKQIEGSPEVDQPAISIETLKSIQGWIDNSNGRVFLIPSKIGVDSVYQVNNLNSFKWPLENSLKVHKNEESYAKTINIYYYKKVNKARDDIVISRDNIIIRKLWNQNHLKYELTLNDSKNKPICLVKILIL